MPAIITHDLFGRDVYGELFGLIGGTKDEAEAFLLGNQGPDPLFYTVVSPTLTGHHRLGSTMHAKHPARLLDALKRSLALLDEGQRSVGRAYALGFLCHYTLDSTMHPFVYYHQYALCDAGEPGLSREDGSEVHAAIESDLDELVLYTKLGQTVATFDTSRQILRGRDEVLRAVSRMYAFMAREVYDEDVPDNIYVLAVKDFRFVQGFFHSPHGVKRELLGTLECAVRPHSFLRAMSHRAIEATSSIFDNAEHLPWENPYTGEVRTASFWDLYEEALAKARDNIAVFDAPGFDERAARELTGELNFSGEPTGAQLLSVEDVPARG